ncbi:hypothetical protein JOF57_000981 [Mycolicibacterium lutetiense]|uniref:Uncharacterized protein n=1 Tax=Mycolicibacterium lutetiense TaxID=1641992 RepID=A0ABS4ZPJ4_9MYCO|nr:hypothetical protein [Mycolicibacterium lutetiense]
MPFIAPDGARLSWAAATAAHDTNGHAVHPFVEDRPKYQLPEQVLRYLPPRQIPSRIASGARGAVARTSLSSFDGESGGAQKISEKQEVREMPERTFTSPAVVELPGTGAAMHAKVSGAQLNSVESRIDRCPTGRLARAESGVAA